MFQYWLQKLIFASCSLIRLYNDSKSNITMNVLVVGVLLIKLIIFKSAWE